MRHCTSVGHVTGTDLLTSAEVAEILGTTKRTVNRHAALGKIPAQKLPGRTDRGRGQYVFSRQVIDLLVAQKGES